MNELRYPIIIVVTIWTIILMSNIAFAQVSFRTDLAGEKEVPPLFSESYGSALIVGNNSSLKYQINVTSLDKVTGAFLHKGDLTENGEVLVSLINSTEPSGMIDGKLVEGTINSSSIVVPLANLTTNIPLAVPTAGNFTNMTSAVPTAGNFTNMTSAVSTASKLEALIDLMNQNMTYINIHTSKFPEGELRGTLTNSTG
jgi:hypothetical protein